MSFEKNSSSMTSCFAGTASAYGEYRPAYPAAVIHAVVERCCLKGTGRILDIGCGPGLLSIPLSRFANEVVALDIDQDMIAVACAQTARTNIQNVIYHVMNGENISHDLGSFQAAVFGNSFHWMNRLLIAQKLHSQLLSGGHIAILTGFYIWHSAEKWKQIVRQTITEFTGEDRSEGMNIMPSDSDILSGAGYADIETWNYEAPQTYSLSSLMGFLASTSYASRRKFGERADEFERILSQRLLNVGDFGTYTEKAKFTLVTAKRA